MNITGRQLLIGLVGALVLAGIGAAVAQQTNYIGAVFISDKTTPSRQLTVNSDGSINTTTTLAAATTVTVIPSATAANGIAPVVSASAEGSHVLKATPGNLYQVYAQNLTATAGFLIVLNSTTVPSDGAVTPLAAVNLPANGVAAIDFGVIPSVYSTGITAVVTSATTPFTKTTGVITAFISGSVQ